jgi:hypothetical protein
VEPYPTISSLKNRKKQPLAALLSLVRKARYGADGAMAPSAPTHQESALAANTDLTALLLHPLLSPHTLHLPPDAVYRARVSVKCVARQLTGYVDPLAVEAGLKESKVTTVGPQSAGQSQSPRMGQSQSTHSGSPR